MATQPHVVIIGAGIVGCALADELSDRGWNRITVLEQGPLFEPEEGTDTPDPGFVFQVGECKTLTEFAAYTVEKYGSLDLRGRPCFRGLGSLELATDPQRWEGLRRKSGWAASWGVDAALLTPEECAGLHPALDGAGLLGGLHTPGDGVVDTRSAAEAQAARAMERGVRFLPHHRVTGVERRSDRVRAVTTEHGSFRADVVVACAGAWGAEVGAMVDLPVPVAPMAHQYVRTGPPAPPRHTGGERAEAVGPLLYHRGTALCLEHHPGSAQVRAHGHRPLPGEPCTGPGPDLGAEPEPTAAAPATPSDPGEDSPWQALAGLVPALAGVETEHVADGAVPFTPDGKPLLGEHPSLGGFWSMQAVVARHSAGAARAVAEWIMDGQPRGDLHCCELNRFEEVQLSPAYVHQRSRQVFAEFDTGVRTSRSVDRARPLRASPFYERQVELGARFLESAGWECPQWYEANASLPEVAQVLEHHGWPHKDWSPVVGAEALAARERVAVFDMTPLKRVEISGPEALSFLQTMTTNQIDRELGTVVHTLMLDDEGRVRGDLMVARTGETRFLIGANSNTDVDWLRRHLPRNGTVQLRDTTSGTCCIGLWGPRSRELLQGLTPQDFSHRAFGCFEARRAYVGAVPVTALRVSYVGELGWELHTDADLGRRLWDTLWEAGRAHGLVAAGRGAFDSMRMEKGHRFWSRDVTTEHDPYEAGLGFAVRMDKGYFRGREALEERAGTAGVRTLACLTIDDPRTSVSGSEPVHADGAVVGHVTSADLGYTVGRSIAYAWIPAALAAPGQHVEIEYLGERVKATVAVEPLFDPETARFRS